LRDDLRYASGLDAVMVGWPVLIRIVYLLGSPDILPRCPGALRGHGEGC